MIANLTFLLFQTSLGPDLNLLAKLKGKILLVKFFMITMVCCQKLDLKIDIIN